MTCLAAARHYSLGLQLTCTACELAQYRTQVVPGHGNIRARIMLICEAPGKVEDREGKPLVGPAGKKLDELLGEAELSRDELWLSNCVMCRPPENALRNHPDAIIRCPTLWLEKEIDILRPKVLVVMGAIAIARWFPGYTATEASELARCLPNGTVAVASYHPAHSFAFRGGKVVGDSIVESLRRAKRLANA